MIAHWSVFNKSLTPHILYFSFNRFATSIRAFVSALAATFGTGLDPFTHNAKEVPISVTIDQLAFAVYKASTVNSSIHFHQMVFRQI